MDRFRTALVFIIEQGLILKIISVRQVTRLSP